VLTEALLDILGNASVDGPIRAPEEVDAPLTPNSQFF
jgi:hypothetical protein